MRSACRGPWPGAPRAWLLALALACLHVPGALAATIVIQVADAPGEGFNDPAPFTPVGGNTATTLGEARRKVFEEAARIWGGLVTSSVTIKVEAKFDPLACTSTSASLGGASPTLGYRDFPGAPVPGVIYPAALADALTGIDIAEQSSETTGTPDIRTVFNSTLDSSPTCLGGRRFYYGLDHRLDQNGDGMRDFASDLLRVVLHELAHGLGFVSLVNPTTGEGSLGSDGVVRLAIFDQFVFDETLALPWTQMSSAQRVQSARNTGKLAWDGPRVNARLNRLTDGISAGRRLRLYAPAPGAAGGPVSHWDTAARPDVLMEPFETSVATSTTDFTTCLLADIGWTVTTRRCPDLANGLPVATAQNASTPEDTPRRILLTGADPDRDAIRFSVASNPARGTLSGTAPDLTYTPNANANGMDSFGFTVADDFDVSTTAAVTIDVAPVNDAPQASGRSATATSGQATSILLEASDVDGDPLTYLLVNAPTAGQVSLNGATATYSSNPGFTGSDSFTFRVSDGTLASAPATVTLTVSAGSPAGGGSTSASSGGGGGGSTSLAVLMALLLWIAAQAGVARPSARAPRPRG